MRPGARFDIEIESADGRSDKLAISCTNEEAALAFVNAHLHRGNELFVACLGSGVDYGNLHIELKLNGAAEITAHEHRGFKVEVASREQALSAFEYWLPVQERDPGLQWEEL